MTIDEIIEEMEYEIVECEKGDRMYMIPGLKRAIEILREL